VIEAPLFCEASFGVAAGVACVLCWLLLGWDWLGVVSCATASAPASNMPAVSAKTFFIEILHAFLGERWKWRNQLDTDKPQEFGCRNTSPLPAMKRSPKSNDVSSERWT
jgi:hypothetical protein